MITFFAALRLWGWILGSFLLAAVAGLTQNRRKSFTPRLLPVEETGKNNVVSLTFDAGEFDFQGQHGQTYTIPIAGGFKINERVRLDYEIPLQYITLDRKHCFKPA